MIPDNLLDDFFDWLLAEKGLSNNTFEAYKRDLVDLKFFLNGKPWNQVTNEDLKNYIINLQIRHFQSSTQMRKISSFRQFFHFLHVQDIISANPAKNIPFPKYSRKLPSVLSTQEIEILLDYAQRDTSAEGIRLYCLLEMLYSSGMRVSEIIELPFSSIRYNQETRVIDKKILIKGKGQKERMVPLTSKAVFALESYLKARKDYFKGDDSSWLFPSQGFHLTRQRFGQLLKELALKSGIDPQKVSPHGIRHAFATHLLQNGADLVVIQKLLGHEDISTTQIYTHLDKGHLMDLIDKHHPIAQNH